MRGNVPVFQKTQLPWLRCNHRQTSRPRNRPRGRTTNYTERRNRQKSIHPSPTPTKPCNQKCHFRLHTYIDRYQCEDCCKNNAIKTRKTHCRPHKKVWSVRLLIWDFKNMHVDLFPVHFPGTEGGVRWGFPVFIGHRTCPHTWRRDRFVKSLAGRIGKGRHWRNLTKLTNIFAI